MHSLRSGLQLEARPGRTGASINHHTEGSQMPRNQSGFKVVDNSNEESGRKSRGRALNRVTLVGRLASDPELHYTPSGSAVAQLRLATNEGEEPEFHALSAWGKLAEFAGSYLKKGRLVYLEGLGRQHAAQLRGAGLEPAGLGPAARSRRAVGRGGPVMARLFPLG